MNASKLIHRAVLLVPVDTGNTRGGQTVGYSIDGELFCAIEPFTARELIFSKQLKADVTHKVTMRYTARVNHRCRLQWDGKVFELGPPLPTAERREEMIFTATEVIGQVLTTTTTPAP
jgi:SPP1 family predicted phage head-tail adaptor